jgi:hypothetical protein
VALPGLVPCWSTDRTNDSEEEDGEDLLSSGVDDIENPPLQQEDATPGNMTGDHVDAPPTDVVVQQQRQQQRRTASNRLTRQPPAPSSSFSTSSSNSRISRIGSKKGSRHGESQQNNKEDGEMKALLHTMMLNRQVDQEFHREEAKLR